ncbi:hypothetical protein H920_10162 [Fukomys damarensis]|uniref:Uncharacterized protein n=1 Tax=Fukomys damarensis TaxID=885580 RepID=A0A091DZR6_FUKDA|nr:hypothetical protein H920_10162 [Fukomys damarensis]
MQDSSFLPAAAGTLTVVEDGLEDFTHRYWVTRALGPKDPPLKSSSDSEDKIGCTKLARSHIQVVCLYRADPEAQGCLPSVAIEYFLCAPHDRRHSSKEDITSNMNKSLRGPIYPEGQS